MLGSEASSDVRQNAFIDQTLTTDGTHDAKLSLSCQSPALSNLYVLCGTRMKQNDYRRSVVLPTPTQIAQHKLQQYNINYILYNINN